MNNKRPFIVTLLGDLCVLTALLRIISLMPNLTEGFGIYIRAASFFPEGFMNILIPIIMLIAAYGYFSLKSWGYWLMIACNVFFLASNILAQQSSPQYSTGI
jgi:hypothetical protein